MTSQLPQDLMYKEKKPDDLYSIPMEIKNKRKEQFIILLICGKFKKTAF